MGGMSVSFLKEKERISQPRRQIIERTKMSCWRMPAWLSLPWHTEPADTFFSAVPARKSVFRLNPATLLPGTTQQPESDHPHQKDRRKPPVQYSSDTAVSVQCLNGQSRAILPAVKFGYLSIKRSRLIFQKFTSVAVPKCAIAWTINYLEKLFLGYN